MVIFAPVEDLHDIKLFDLRGVDVSLLQTILIAVAIVGLLLIGWAVLGRLLPWFYGLESTTEENQPRVRNVVRFVILSLIGIAVVQILEVDYEFLPEEWRRLRFKRNRPGGDGSEPLIELSIHISTIIRGLIAITLANVLDLIIEEFLTQRYHRLQRAGGLSDRAQRNLVNTKQRFAAVAPLMYTLAVGFIAQDIGISRYWFAIGADSSITVGGIISGVFVFFLVRLLVLIITTFFLNSYYQRSKIDVGSQYAINRLLTYFAYLIGVLLIIQAAGFDLIAVWTGAAALLVGIGIGLQQTFNDLICGVIILFERSVMVGDVVELSGHQVGTVRKIGARTSTVETRDDIIIFVPNSKLIGENVTNWSHVQRLARFHVPVGVAYGSDTALVKKILLEVANGHDRIVQAPQPFVRFLDFGSSSLDFDLLFWTRDFTRVEDIKSDLRFAIDAAFRAQGVEIPFPQRDLWVRGGGGVAYPGRGGRGRGSKVFF